MRYRSISAIKRKQKELLEHGRAWFMSLARLENLIISAEEHAPKASASNVVRGCEVIVLLTGAVDFQAELARLDKEIGKVDIQEQEVADVTFPESVSIRGYKPSVKGNDLQIKRVAEAMMEQGVF